jgi:hypothetical protein
VARPYLDNRQICYISVQNGTDTNLRRAYILHEGAHVQALLQKKVAQAYRVGGAILLYRLKSRSPSVEEEPLLHPEPWWNVVFVLPLFLRTLLRLIFLCGHRHKGPPITPRDPYSSRLPAGRSFFHLATYVTCLDCGHKFAYNHKTMQLVDFWGIHDAEAVAGIRRKFNGVFSPFRDLVASVGTFNTGIPMDVLFRSARLVAILTKRQWNKTRRLIGSN